MKIIRSFLHLQENCRKMKGRLTILLILVPILCGAGCSTQPNSRPQDVIDTVAQDDYPFFYYRGEGDTTLTSEELRKQYEHYISLAWKAKLKGSMVDVLKNFEKAISVNDSIQKITRAESIYMQDYQQTKDENKMYKWLMIIGTFLLVLWLSRGVFLYIRRKKAGVEVTLESKESRSATDIQQKLRVATFKQSDLYHKILLAAKDDNINISPVSQPILWVSIQENLDFLFSGFTKRLMEECPDLSETEQQICWLSKLDIQPSGIARILKLSRQAITNARSRIAKKIAGKEGDCVNFTHFIESL